MLIILDIDDTVADTIPIWLRRYNRKYHDNLKKEQIVSWDLTKYVVPECGKKIYDFIDYGNMYRYVKPVSDALEGVTKLRDLGFEIAYATAGTPKSSLHKWEWVQEYGFWQPQDHYIQTASKHLLRGDLIIDDNYKNVSKFVGFGILFGQPWNRSENHFPRMTWKEIINDIDSYVQAYL